MKKILSMVLIGLIVSQCTAPKKKEETTEKSPIEEKLATYREVKLTTDISQLSDSEKQMIPLMIEAAKIMDDLFWYEAYGGKEEFLNSLSDEATRKYALINYGPWDRLNNNEPFIDGVGPKPEGANFYPTDLKERPAFTRLSEGMIAGT